MTVLAFALFTAAVVVMVLVHRQTQKRLAAELLDREEVLNKRLYDRQVAMDKQAKVFVRNLARTERAANRMIDQSRDLQGRVAEALNDPRIQRLLNERHRDG